MKVFVHHLDELLGRSLIGSLTKAKHTVIGTKSSQNASVPSNIRTVPSDDFDEVATELLDADVIIYPIFGASDETAACEQAIQALHDADYAGSKTFICVSTVLTWDRTVREDEDSEDPFAEEDFRKRKPHPNFKHYAATEKLVSRLRKKGPTSFLKTYIVCAGLIYGLEEWLLHPWFKDAWELKQPALDCYGAGENVVPTIHVTDLANIITRVIKEQPSSRYIVAVDNAQNTLREIVDSINMELGTKGKVHTLKKDEVLLLKDIEIFLVNMRFDASTIREWDDFEWHCEEGLVERIGDVVYEFRETRGLLPLKIFIHGPPASGKSYLAAEIAKQYKIVHLSIKDILDEAYKTADEDTREEIDAVKEENNGRLTEELVTRFVKRKLKSRPCVNQGYVLDGYPKTVDDCKILFVDPEEDDDDGGDDENPPQRAPIIVPEYVISLEATDEFLADRVMALPQAQVEGTHNDEDGFRRRLEQFRELNTETATLLNYFEERDIDPLVVSIDGIEEPLPKIYKRIGSAHNYGPTAEELAIAERLQREREDETREALRQEKEVLDKEEAERRSKRDAKERARLAAIQKQEREMLDVHALPLRKYLLDNIMPAVTEALIEVTKVRPDDPIDYLAEYLFRCSPEEVLESRTQK
eukprot:TRINITY_DN473_c0_g1_i1.p1 TRINITY_DN473_c0_g1~~TRINITY_DN473_c0_g1_i1.p1  ORF type:complete len:643 (+),score=212.44 TRINITY_DN473_c0_g1_i1:345-2273(+)